MNLYWRWMKIFSFIWDTKRIDILQVPKGTIFNLLLNSHYVSSRYSVVHLKAIQTDTSLTCARYNMTWNNEYIWHFAIQIWPKPTHTFDTFSSMQTWPKPTHTFDTFSSMQTWPEPTNTFDTLLYRYDLNQRIHLTLFRACRHDLNQRIHLTRLCKDMNWTNEDVWHFSVQIFTEPTNTDF